MASSDGRPIYPHTKNARRLRRNATMLEGMLWDRLRAGRLAGLKFCRQQPIGPYIVDFFCHEVALVVFGNNADQAIQLQKALGATRPSPQPSPTGRGSPVTLRRPPVCCGGACGRSASC